VSGEAGESLRPINASKRAELTPWQTRQSAEGLHGKIGLKKVKNE